MVNCTCMYEGDLSVETHPRTGTVTGLCHRPAVYFRHLRLTVLSFEQVKLKREGFKTRCYFIL